MKEVPKPLPLPRWYQDLSIPQMEKVFELGDIMLADYVERVTGRTQRALGDIGVTSTFVKITSEQIRELRRLADLDPVKFLSEIYRIITGRYFIDEEYKKVYDCNERIILSAIAFLTLPEVVIELHSRIPMGANPKFPPKPVRQKIPPRKRAASPYLEPLFVRPDRLAYQQELHLWRKRCQAIPVPRAIFPPCMKHHTIVQLPAIVESRESYHEEKTDKKKDYTSRVTSLETESPELREDKSSEKGQKRDHYHHVTLTDKENKLQAIIEKETTNPRNDFSKPLSNEQSSRAENENNLQLAAGTAEQKIPHNRQDYSRQPRVGRNPKGEEKDKQLIVKDQQIFGVHENEVFPHSRLDYSKQPHTDKKSSLDEKDKQLTVFGAHESKVLPPRSRLDYSKRPHSDKKSCFGEKDTHLILAGISETADYPVSYETSGLAYVTPDNSDESFFAELNLPVVKQKKYPRGRENLSRNWQEWLQTADEEYMKVEKEANKIIKSIQDTLKLIGPEISCDNCCSCRQTRKANIKYHKTKTPHVVIDSVAFDGKQNKYIVGSLSMNSPAPSPSSSTADLPEIIASHDKIVKNKIISGVTNEKGETKFYISGVSKEIERVPRKIVSNSKLPKTIKNVPPCGCAIEKFINEDLASLTSDDNIPWSKTNNLCIGKKFRPGEIGACQKYPNDKFCGRNPFKKKVDDKIKAALRSKNKTKDDDYYSSEKKNMYSLAAFQPCGDEDGMAVCGGPWGAVNIPDADELARREAEAKLILQSPPCGDKPGRAVCGAPFGTRHPIPKKPKKDDEDDDEEEEEEIDEEELKERKKREREARKKAREPKVEKQLNRDEHCVTVAEKIGGTDKTGENSLAHRTGQMEKYRSTKIVRSDKKSKSIRESESEYESKAKMREKRKSSESHEFTKSKKRTRGRSKEERKQDAADEEKIARRAQTKELKNRWNRMKKLANKFITSPIVLPEEPPRTCKREDLQICCQESEDDARLLDEETVKEGPFGWRTKSEEELPPEKTLVYLVNPGEHVETVPLRPGGKPCQCRENRNKRKILLYNVSAMVPETGKGKRDTKHSRVIDGLIYITPTPSARISDEYVPEYELYDSPYEMCVRQRKNNDFKNVEQYLGPKSLIAKKTRVSEFCGCSSTNRSPTIVNDVSNKISNENENALITEIKDVAIPAEKRWQRAFETEGLVNFYARCRDNVPCWLRCIEFSKDGCCVVPRSLQVKKPVCECKYERKILRREEEKTNWLRRQEKLKTMKKQPCNQVAGLSRPMRTETYVMISNVTRVRREVEDIDDINYCVTGIAQDRVMGPAECIVTGVGMHTPVITPEISKIELPAPKPHRHWSPMNIHTGPAVFANVKNPQLSRDSEPEDWRNKLRSKADKRIDVLFQSGQDQIEGPYQKFGRNEKEADNTATKSTKVNKDLVKGKTGKAMKFPLAPSAKEQPRQLRGARSVRADVKKKLPINEQSWNESSVNAESTKKSSASPTIQLSHKSQNESSVRAESKEKSSAPAIQQSHKPQNVGLVRGESTTKSSVRELGKEEKGEKINVHTTKSTGDILLKETKAGIQGIKTEVTSKTDLTKLLQIELEKMASEGFLFAKLPACHLMPQLQYWIMYRKGIAFAPEEKKRLMDQSIKTWNAMEKAKPNKIEAPVIEVPKEVLENLTFDKAEEIKRDVAMKKATFYSQIRKLRVLQARTMWNLMEFGKFPGVSFKKAYFTYQAGKEADGFVFKPWEKK